MQVQLMPLLILKPLVLLQIFLELAVDIAEPEFPYFMMPYLFVSLLAAGFGVLSGVQVLVFLLCSR